MGLPSAMEMISASLVRSRGGELLDSPDPRAEPTLLQQADDRIAS